MFKRGLSLLLTAALLLGLAVPVYADEIASGTCGANLTWTLDSDGTLTISGTGEMDIFTYPSYAPWYNNRNQITSAYFCDGVTTIGNHAFHNYRNLTSISISESVTRIGDYAFSECSSLTSITIPKSVTSMGESVFKSCGNLTSVTISEGAICIGDYAFSGCEKLISVLIPESVTSIGKYAFNSCKRLKDITIPEKITNIGDSVFRSCSGLTSVIIPNGVINIGYCAFGGCTSLASIMIPESVAIIDDHAFNGCKSLKSITIPESVTSIGVSAFCGCKGLTSIMIPGSISNMGEGAFSECNGLVSVTIANGVTSIASRMFYGCKGLKSITIPGSVTCIGEYAFSDCSNLTSIALSEGVTCIGDFAFNYCTSLMSILIPNGVTSLGDGAFNQCTGLTSVSIPESIDYIGADVFNGCSDLASVSIPKSVTSIGNHAFVCCTSLVSVTIPEGVTSIGDGAFDSCISLVSASIPESVTSIGNQAFYECRRLASISIPRSVTSIREGTFGGCSSLTNISIPENVTSIEDGAFYGCSGLTSIIIPKSVITVGNYAFDGCSGLMTISISENVTRIGYLAFSECIRLTEVSIPESVISIGPDAFSGCSGLTSIEIPESVTSIGNYAFDGCGNLILYVFPNSVAEQYAIANEIPYEYVFQDVSLTLTVADEQGDPLTTGYTVRWYEAGNDDVLSMGSTLHGIDTAKTYAYEITLDEALGLRYVQPERVTIADNEAGEYTFALTPLPTMTVSARVADADGAPLRGASVAVTQIVNRRYTNTVSAVTGSDGAFRVTLPAGETRLAVSLDGYFTVTRAVPAEGGSLGDLTLTALPQSRITLSLSSRASAPEGEQGALTPLSSDGGLAITLYNETQWRDVTEFAVQYPELILRGGVSGGDTLRVHVEDPTGALGSAETTAKLDDYGVGAASLTLVERGSITAAPQSDGRAVMLVFDANGTLAARAVSEDGRVSSGALADGEYRVVLMRKTELLPSVAQLSRLAQFGLAAGTDYALREVSVARGVVSDLGAVTVPALDESRLLFTKAENTMLTAGQSSVTVGRYVSLRAQYKIKPQYQSGGETVSITLPSSLTLVDGSVTLDGKPCTYTQSDGTLTVVTRKSAGTVRCYMTATEAGTVAAEAYLSFTLPEGSVTQPIGTTEIAVNAATLSVAGQTGRTSVPVSGQAIAGSAVRVLDNGAVLAETTANKAGTWNAVLDLGSPENNSAHEIQAEITTPAGARYRTAAKTLLYHEDYADVERVVMHNSGQRTIFDFSAVDNSKHAYSYAPGAPDFTFVVELYGEADAVQVVTTDQSGDETIVECTYDAVSGTWIGTHAYRSFNSVPVSVSVSYTQRMANGTTRRGGTANADATGTDMTFALPEATPPDTPEAGMDFGASSVSPTLGGSGVVTLRVNGTLLEPNAVLTLTGGGETYTTKDVYWINHETLYATFALGGASDGAYSLHVVCGENESVLSDCFTVDGSLPKGKLVYDVQISESASPGQTLTGSVIVTNTGYTDAPAPLVALSGDNLLLGEAGDEALLLFLQNGDGLAGTLTHGETAGGSFSYRPAEDGSYDLRLLDCSTLDGAIPSGTVDGALADSLLSMMGGTYRRLAASAARMANAMDDGGSEITLEAIEAAYLQNLVGVSDGLVVIENAVDIVSTELAFAREYRNPVAGGAGWTTNYDMTAAYAAEDGAEVIVVSSPDAVSVYTKNEEGVFVNLLSDTDTAARNSDGSITVTRRSGETLRFNADGTLASDTDIHGNSVTLSYNADKQPVRIASTNGDALALSYTDGKLTAVTSETTGDSVSYCYSGDCLTSVTTKYGTTAYTYAAATNALTRVTYPDGTYLSCGYDEYGRVARMDDGELTVSYTYGLYEITARDSMGNATRTKYDALGNAVWSIDAQNRVSYAEYDDELRLTRLSAGLTYAASYEYGADGLPTKALLPDGSAVQYAYDALGNLTAVTDAKGQTTAYERDAKGSTTAIRHADGSAETYTYDAKGRVATATTRGGVTVTYTYDDAGNVTRATYSTGEAIDYTYDAYGNVTSITEGGETTTLAYNDKGDLTSVTYPDGKSVSYAYDALGRKTAVTDSDGYVTGYAYNEQGLLESVTDGTDALVSYAYNPDGTLSRQTNANGTYTEYAYQNGELVLITNYGADRAPMSSFAYAYDELGQIVAMTEDGTRTWRYAYDALGQLVRAEAPDGTVTEYAYDAAGNRTSVSAGGAEIDYTANELNQYTAYGDALRTYDADGNLLSETRGGRTATYAWNVYGQLTRYTDFDGKVWEYGYDAFGLRSSVTVDGETTTYLNDPTGCGFAVASYSGERATHYAVAGGVTASRDREGTYYYHANHLGSVTEITGADGAVVNRYRYDQEGGVTAKTEGMANPYTYVGVYGIVNDGNGLIYDRARYVSAESMSFVSEDPAGQTYDLNGYRYVNGNPIQVVDFTGFYDYIPNGADWGEGFGTTPDETRIYFNKDRIINDYTNLGKNETRSGNFFLDGVEGVNKNELKLEKAIEQATKENGKKAVGKAAEKTAKKVAGKGAGKAVANIATKGIGRQALGGLLIDSGVGIALGIALLIPDAWNLGWDIAKNYPNNPAGIIGQWLGGFLYPVPATPILDPSGYVYAGVTSNPIEGVTATVYYEAEVLNDYGEPTGAYETRLWDDAADYNEVNPQTTDALGQYGWDVFNGKWRVHYEKEGYEDYWTDWMEVPPEYTDVNINLRSTAAPEVTSVDVYAEEVRIAFSQYMNVESVASAVRVTVNGVEAAGTVLPVDAESNFEGTETSASVFRFAPAAPLYGAVGVRVDGAVSYAGRALVRAYESGASVRPQPEGVTAAESLYVDYQDEGAVTVRILPAEAGAGTDISVRSSSPSVLLPLDDTLTADETGAATFRFLGALPGAAELTFSVAGTELAAVTRAAVVRPRVDEIVIKEAETWSVQVSGGSGVGSYEEGATVRVNANEPTEGYVFWKWSGTEDLTLADGMDASAEELVFAMPAHEVRLAALYAVEEGRQLTIRFAAGDGSTEGFTETVREGEAFVLPECPFAAPQDCRFLGWRIGKSVCEAGTAYAFADSATVAAAWEDIAYTPVWLWAEDYGAASVALTGGDGAPRTADARVSVARTEPTHTADGVAVYTAVASYGVKTYTDSKTVLLSATGHSYREPVWTWTEDHSGATATFVCQDGDDTVTLTGKITCVRTEPYYVYTATVSFNGQAFQDTKSVLIVPKLHAAFTSDNMLAYEIEDLPEAPAKLLIAGYAEDGRFLFAEFVDPAAAVGRVTVQPAKQYRLLLLDANRYSPLCPKLELTK